MASLQDLHPDAYIEYIEHAKNACNDRVDPTKKRQRLVKFEDRLNKSEVTQDDFLKRGRGES